MSALSTELKKYQDAFRKEAPEEVKEIMFAAKNIQFETGSDVIRTVSYKDLDNIVTIMNRFPGSSFNIH